MWYLPALTIKLRFFNCTHKVSHWILKKKKKKWLRSKIFWKPQSKKRDQKEEIRKQLFFYYVCWFRKYINRLILTGAYMLIEVGAVQESRTHTYGRGKCHRVSFSFKDGSDHFLWIVQEEVLTALRNLLLCAFTVLKGHGPFNILRLQLVCPICYNRTGR